MNEKDLRNRIFSCFFTFVYNNSFHRGGSNEQSMYYR